MHGRLKQAVRQCKQPNAAAFVRARRRRKRDSQLGGRGHVACQCTSPCVLQYTLSSLITPMSLSPIKFESVTVRLSRLSTSRRVSTLLELQNAGIDRAASGDAVGARVTTC